MRIFALILLAVFFAAAPASAQDTGDMAKRTELATEIHKYFNVQERLFRTLDGLTGFMSPTQKQEFWLKINSTLTPERLNEVSIPAMAETFTAGELETMLAYYSAAPGQSAEKKRPEYEDKATAGFRKLIDEAVINTGPMAKPSGSLYSR